MFNPGDIIQYAGKYLFKVLESYYIGGVPYIDVQSLCKKFTVGKIYKSQPATVFKRAIVKKTLCDKDFYIPEGLNDI